MGNGSVRLVAVLAVAAVAEIVVDVDVAEAAPDRPVAEAETEAGSSNTCPNLCFDHQASSVKNRCCQIRYQS